MIKYLGSKRRLIPTLEVLAAASGSRTAVDLFTGTTRVAQGFKRQGLHVTAVDTSRTGEVLARCYAASDPDDPALAPALLADAVEWLNNLPGEPGYVTDTFCIQSRYFQPGNGARIDAVRHAIESEFAGTALWPILLTSLLEAADRVDSTAGLQMAYLKQWSPRSFRPLLLRVPELISGPGRALRGDAMDLAGSSLLGPVDLAYLDPPYNQHRYDANYHVWETLVAWDAPEFYGVACKRIDLRQAEGRSLFNSRRTMPEALSSVVRSIEADVVVLSYNDESWLSRQQLDDCCSVRGHVEVLSFDSARYVGAQIGIHNPQGKKVGAVSHLRNTEYVVVAGDRARVRRMVRALRASGLAHAPPPSVDVPA